MHQHAQRHGIHLFNGSATCVIFKELDCVGNMDVPSVSSLPLNTPPDFEQDWRRIAEQNTFSLDVAGVYGVER
jgi:hypothetical protein